MRPARDRGAPGSSLGLGERRRIIFWEERKMKKFGYFAAVGLVALSSWITPAFAREKVWMGSWTNCLHYDGSENKISNSCDDPVEAYWRDTRGGRNQVTIRAYGYYQGGAPVEEMYACAYG